ncbi:50S ribosomal protein L24 [Peptoanaerobacter stomatis]|uniref:Large ribosomal subunit protein uL24 n=1 Tax=Peptoanaerobacter stomatis TaxID=796937 RepID=G9WXP6_9FIRM|nr:50S ribosomal protein L24 [Peptoanaerobacter stomatis]EHL16893.1 50S ribosomal protein L24 [Peptoanaerobacter stomatis]
MRIKSGDTVVVIAGKDKGKKGKVLEAYPSKEKVLVEGVNIATKSQKPNKLNPQGGIIKKEMPIHVSNVMYYDAKAGKGVRVGYKILENGKKVRISKKTGEEI